MQTMKRSSCGVSKRKEALSAKLHQAVLACRSAIDAIPLDAGIDQEFEAISRATRIADRVARRILLARGLPRFSMPKVRAAAWLEGDYWLTVG